MPGNQQIFLPEVIFLFIDLLSCPLFQIGFKEGPVGCLKDCYFNAHLYSHTNHLCSNT